jgi:hypothetical protein
MAEGPHLDCKIYVDTPVTADQLTRQIADVLSAKHDVNTVYTADQTLDIVENDDFDATKRTDFPDGFLYFPYYVEIYARRDVPHQKQVDLVSALLTYFWAHGMAAVAACDYETELPNDGGYKSRMTPWPTD